jgi:DNA-binding transcriptional ArsR family regulator
VALDRIRARLLAELCQPASAAGLAERVGLPRQKVNYHLRLLEQHGLIELVEERRKGNCTERVLRATATSYVISPEALDTVAPDLVPRRGVTPRSCLHDAAHRAREGSCTSGDAGHRHLRRG